MHAIHSVEKGSDIDVHVVKHPTQRRRLDELIVQLENEPVNIQVVQGVEGKTGPGRFKGFSAGSAKWCTYADDDDLIEPGIFDKVLTTFYKEPDTHAIVTEEKRILIDPDGVEVDSCIKLFYFKFYLKPHLMFIHHLGIYERATVEKYLNIIADWSDGVEHFLWACHLREDRCIRHLPELGYHWYLHAGGIHRKQLQVPAEAKAMCDQVVSEGIAMIEAGALPEEQFPHNLIKRKRALQRKQRRSIKNRL